MTRPPSTAPGSDVEQTTTRRITAPLDPGTVTDEHVLHPPGTRCGIRPDHVAVTVLHRTAGTLPGGPLPGASSCPTAVTATVSGRCPECGVPGRRDYTVQGRPWALIPHLWRPSMPDDAPAWLTALTARLIEADARARTSWRARAAARLLRGAAR